MSHFFYMNVNGDNNKDFIIQTLHSHGFYDAKILKQKEIQISSDIKIGSLVRIALMLPDSYPDYLKIINDMRKEYKAIYILKY